MGCRGQLPGRGDRSLAWGHWGRRVSVSILVVDGEPDVALLFRQRFRREARDGTYVMHFANSAEGALQLLGEGSSRN